MDEKYTVGEYLKKHEPGLLEIMLDVEHSLEEGVVKAAAIATDAGIPRTDIDQGLFPKWVWFLVYPCSLIIVHVLSKPSMCITCLMEVVTI
jgi:hypothetical protein